MPDDDAFKAELRKAVLPIVLEDENGTIEVVGTGFVIRANGRQAHVVTAGHVASYIRRIDRPEPRYHPSALFVPTEYRVELSRTMPYALYQDPSRGACRIPIEAFLELGGLDLALCSIRFGDGVAADIQFDKQFLLDTTPVRAGEPLIAFGYTEGKVEPVAEQSEGTWVFNGRWRHSAGEVLDPSPEHCLAGQGGDCFSCNATFDHGMSGGPVCSSGKDNELLVRGVVSTETVASMIWQILLMPVSLPKPDGYVAGRTLLDLEREGAIVDRGRGSEHIQATRGEDGQIASARWS